MNRAVASSTPPGCTLKRARPLLGTLVEIGASGASADEVGAAIEQAYAAVQTIQTLMSYHDPASEVSLINRAGAGCVRVHPHTWQVLNTARAIAEASHGLFDITIAPELVRQAYLPHHADLAHPAPGSNWQHIELLPDHRVRLLQPLHIDLGGIAKGYAVDCAIQTLQDAGMRSGQVNAGGDLRLFGEVTETIHVRHPNAATQLLPLCQLHQGAVATSAPYFTHRHVRGRAASPLINPETRQPCTDTRSVSVLADSCMVADALTKVVFTAPDRAIAALNHFGAHAVVLDAVPNAPAHCRVRLSEPRGWRDASPSNPEAVAA